MESIKVYDGKYEFCTWESADEDLELGGTYATECGRLWQLNDGTLKENGVVYCYHCGRQVKQIVETPYGSS